MRTTLELPDPLFARLKARAAGEQTTLKQLLRNYVEQGLNAAPPTTAPKRTGIDLLGTASLRPGAVLYGHGPRAGKAIEPTKADGLIRSGFSGSLRSAAGVPPSTRRGHGNADLPARLHTDAYLAALAISNGWRLVSFDRDFKRFNGLNWLQIS